MRYLHFVSLALLTIFLIASGPSFAGDRVALVIGNTGYQKVPRLANPANDASALGKMFKEAGFDHVDTRFDLSAVELRKALREFGARARAADVAVVYYAGHGLELDGMNYLVPINAALETDADVLDEALSLERVLFAVEPAKYLRLIILDACRDSPFAKTMRRTVASRAIGRGLAKVEPTSPNTLIAFAAKAGSTASDGDSAHSPFAAALVEYLPKPGLDLRRAFGFVRDAVLKNTSGKQEPYVYGSLGGDDVPLVRAAAPAAVSQASDQNEVRRDYELTLQAGHREAWEAFIQAHPNGLYSDLAKVQLKKIAAAEAHAAATEKARIAEQEKMRLAALDAKQVEQAKADTAAKVAMQKRLEAEKAEEIEKANVVRAEQIRAAAEKNELEHNDGEKRKLAATQPSDVPLPSPAEIVTSLQIELRRVKCLTTDVDGKWSEASRRSLSLFNKYARTKFDTQVASVEALEAIKSKPAPVCPTICEAGYRSSGDSCVKVTCGKGEALNDEGKCQEKRKPLAAHTKPEKSTLSKRSDKSASSGRCISISQRCALQIGGRCDQATGKWEYGRNGAGGNTLAFNSCVGQALAGAKR